MTWRFRITAFLKRFEADWPLLLFLLLFTDVKSAVKAAALLIIYLLRFNLRFGFNIRNSRLPLFYLIMPCIALVDLLINPSLYNGPYIFSFATGLLFWAACILAAHQVKLSVERNRPEVLVNTVIIFFVINALVSFSQLAAIIWETGAFNPYRYQGNYQKYFTGTGDYIKGVLFDSCPANAALNAFGVIFFLFRTDIAMTLLCMIVLLLTGSNLTNFILLVVFAYLLLFQSSRIQKSVLVCCSMLLVVFMAKVSPQNEQYTRENWEKMAGVKKKTAAAPATIRVKAIPPSEMSRLFPPAKAMPLPSLPKEDIHSMPYQHRSDTTLQQRSLLSFIRDNAANLSVSADSGRLKLPGKLIAMQQTIRFLKDHPATLATGAGMGNFSSKLAFRTAGLGIAGSYPARSSYINNDFLRNHLDLYLYYFSKDARFHSVINLPNSVYDQVISEYGIAGLAAFLVYYIGYFIRKKKRLTYGVPLLIFMTAIFFTDYWFEQLSVVVFFELLLFMDIKEGQPV